MIVQRMLKALGVVTLVCVGVIVLAPLVASALPSLLTIGICIYLTSLPFGGPRWRDRDS